MIYLFGAKFDPRTFQSGISNIKMDIEGLEANKSSEQLAEETPEKVSIKLAENQKLLWVIHYKNSSPAFYVIESRENPIKL